MMPSRLFDLARSNPPTTSLSTQQGVPQAGFFEGDFDDTTGYYRPKANTSRPSTRAKRPQGPMNQKRPSNKRKNTQMDYNSGTINTPIDDWDQTMTFSQYNFYKPIPAPSEMPQIDEAASTLAPASPRISDSSLSLISIDRTVNSSMIATPKPVKDSRLKTKKLEKFLHSSRTFPEEVKSLPHHRPCQDESQQLLVRNSQSTNTSVPNNDVRIFYDVPSNETRQTKVLADLLPSHRDTSSNPNNIFYSPPHSGMEKSIFRKRQVYICVVFLKIGEIDTIKEQYAADVLIKSKWREPALDHQTDLQDFDWSIAWAPKLYIENTIGEAKEHVYQMITFNEYGHAFLCEKRRVSGVFLENLELNHFPFDVQDLTITVASNLTTSDIRLVNDPDEPHRINKQSFVDEQEWYLYKHIETEQKELIYEYTDPTSVRPALSVKCRAARRPAYFIWNIFLVTFLICSLSLVTFAVDKDLPHNRLQLTFTLVLTLVAFKFIVNQCLPKISYLTYLDKYVISSLLLLTLVTGWHGLVVVVQSTMKRLGKEIPEDMEIYVLIGMTLGFAGFNAGFVFMIYKVACKRRRDMKERDKEYVEKVQVQMKAKVHRNMKMVQQTHQLHEVRENGTTSFI